MVEINSRNFGINSRIVGTSGSTHIQIHTSTNKQINSRNFGINNYNKLLIDAYLESVEFALLHPFFTALASIF